MTPIDLIDQMLAKPEFSCTEKQMRFLRDLVIQTQDSEAVKKASEIHKKKVLAKLRGNLTHAKKQFEAAKRELVEWESV